MTKRTKIWRLSCLLSGVCPRNVPHPLRLRFRSKCEEIPSHLVAVRDDKCLPPCQEAFLPLAFWLTSHLPIRAAISFPLLPKHIKHMCSYMHDIPPPILWSVQRLTPNQYFNHRFRLILWSIASAQVVNAGKRSKVGLCGTCLLREQ